MEFLNTDRLAAHGELLMVALRELQRAELPETITRLQGTDPASPLEHPGLASG